MKCPATGKRCKNVMNTGCCMLSSTWHVTFPNKRKRNVSYTHHFSSMFITSPDNQISTVFSFSLIVIILATLPEIRKCQLDDLSICLFVANIFMVVAILENFYTHGEDPPQWLWHSGVHLFACAALHVLCMREMGRLIIGHTWGWPAGHHTGWRKLENQLILYSGQLIGACLGFFLFFFHFLVVLHYLLCIFKARLGRVVGSSFKLVWIKCSVFVCQDTYMLRDVNTMQWWVIANSLSRLPFNGLTWEDVRYWDYNGTCAPRLIYSDDVHGSHEYFELISCACKPRDPASKITANSVN